MSGIPDYILNMFAVAGFVFCGFFAGILIATLIGFIRQKAHELKWHYAYKHRFNKPPLAKCYCKDCCSHDTESDRCHAHPDWYVADDYFCKSAYPKEKE